MRVMAHEAPVEVFGQQAVGYIVEDPTTGAAAYLIANGDNGALLQGVAYGLIAAALVILIGLGMMAGLFGLLLALMFVAVVGLGMWAAYSAQPNNAEARGCFLVGMVWTLTITLGIAGFAVGAGPLAMLFFLVGLIDPAFMYFCIDDSPMLSCFEDNDSPDEPTPPDINACW
jgi:hypothetical protein